MKSATAAELGFSLHMNKNKWPWVRIEHSFSPQALRDRVAALQADPAQRKELHLIGDWTRYDNMLKNTVVEYGMFKA